MIIKKSKQTSKNLGIFLNQYDRNVLKHILTFLPLNHVVLYQDLTKKYRWVFEALYCSIAKDVALIGNRKIQNLISEVCSYNGCIDCGMQKETKVYGHMIDCMTPRCGGLKCPKDCIYGCYICTINDGVCNQNKCSKCILQCEQCFEYVCKNHYANCQQCAITRVRCNLCVEKCMRPSCKNTIDGNKKRNYRGHSYAIDCMFHYCKECRISIEGRMFKKRGPLTRHKTRYAKDGTKKQVVFIPGYDSPIIID